MIKFRQVLKKSINLIRNHSLLAILLLTLIVAIAIRFYYQPLLLLNWDEAYFMEQVYWMSDAFRRLDFTRFLIITKQEFQYPPFFTYFFALPVAFLEPSILTIRIFNIFFYFMGVILMYLITMEISPRHKKITASLAAILFILSPMIINFTAMLMREMMGAALSLLMVYFYIKSHNNNPIYSLLVSLTLLVLTMVKYNYALLVFVPIVINEGIEFITKPKKIITLVKGLIITIPYIVFMYWWIIVVQNGLDHFIVILKNTCGYLTLGTWLDHLLFYPHAIVLLYSPSALLGIITLASFILGIIYFKNIYIRLCWFAGMINLIIGTLHTENLQDRYIFTVVPFIFITSAYVVSDIYFKLLKLFSSTTAKILYYVMFCIFLLPIFKNLIYLPRYIIDVGSLTLKGPMYNQKSFHDNWFDYDTTHWVFPLTSVNDESPRDLIEFVGKNVDLTKQVSVIGEANEISQPYRDIIFDSVIKRHLSPKMPYSEFAAILDISQNSKFYTYDYRKQNEWKMQYRYGVEGDPSWKLLKTRDFSGLGIKASIYAR
jgi:hypothetical protein